MQWKYQAGELLKALHFTNKDVADYCGVSESMLKKVRHGTKNPSPDLAANIADFVRQKVRKLEKMLADGGK